jgi:cytochrome c-type biogenesis protein CcmH/NrfF
MPKTALRLNLLALILIVGLIGVSTVQAQMGGEDLPPGVEADDVYRVSREMYCDVCQGVPVSDCPSPTCAAWRQEIAVLLGEGYTDDQIMERFAVQYGDKISGVPITGKERGIDLRLIALGLPALLVLLLGAGVLWKVLGLQASPDENRAWLAAQAAGLNPNYDRPVPDNVDPRYVDRFLALLKDK